MRAVQVEIVACGLIAALSSCGGSSAYSDIPVTSRSAAPTEEQELLYDVSPDERVLAEISPNGYQHSTGPAAAIPYEPYEFIANCDGVDVRVMEQWEYQKGLSRKVLETTPLVDCSSRHASELTQPTFEGDKGDVIQFVVVDPPPGEWGVLVVAADQS
jgi:hypothetical protein